MIDGVLLYIPKILYPAMDLPLDMNLKIEVDPQTAIILIGKGWIVVDNSVTLKSTGG